MNKPTLYLMVGIPGSGKSWYAKRLLANQENTMYISRDSIRFKFLKENDEYFAKEDVVFNSFVSLIKKHLYDGENVIADATHLNRKSRMKVLNNLDLSKIKICVIYIDVPLDVCLERNSKREGRAKVPPTIIKNMYKNLTYPDKKEQEYYDTIIRVYNY